MSPSFGIAGPVRAATLLLLTAASAAYAGVSQLPFEHGTMSAELAVLADGIVEVRPGPAAVNRLLAGVGQRVTAGEVIAQIDSAEIDQKIEKLRDQSGAVKRQLEAVRVEAQSFNILLEQRLVSRAKVTQLEGQVAELEANRRDLMVRIAAAQEHLARAEVRAPISGTVMTAADTAQGRTFNSVDVLFRIAADPDRIVLSGSMPAAMIAQMRTHGDARGWLGPASWLDAAPLRARLTWVEPIHTAAGDATPTNSAGASAARLEIDTPRSALPSSIVLAPGTRVSVSVRGQQRSLLEQFLEPLRRNLRLPSIV